MEIRDPVHGGIQIYDEEIPIISHDFFGRLRNIKQLGFSEFIFPGATHTRYLHSIGVMEIGSRAFKKLFAEKSNRIDFKRLYLTLRSACLLHDVGHAPLSHATESVMPMLSELEIPDRFIWGKDKKKDRQATHEDYTVKAIVDSSFTSAFTELKEKFGVDPNCVADLIAGHTIDHDYFTVDGVNFFPLLHQLVSSELDCDRMDYLLRDSYFCGVSYGNFDLDWIISNLEYSVINNEAFLTVSEKAVVTFDDFLLSRFHMFMMVYFHYRSVCLEQLLMRYFKTSPHEYQIPSDIEEYQKHDDHYLLKVLRNSKNKYAQAIVKNNIPPKIYESFSKDQLEILEKVEAYLKEQNIDYIRCSSSGRLSKYYKDGEPKHIDEFQIKVNREQKGMVKPIYQDINKATDLFQKFSHAHAVNRLHCDFDNLPKVHQNKILEIINSQHE